MTTATAIPLVDLSWQHARIREEIEPQIAALMESGAFINGPAVSAFESEFAVFSGVRHCVGCANGTDALELALRAASVGPGDEVLLPANTFMATAAAVLRSGAEVRLVDCDDEHLLMDPARVDAAVTGRTAALLPVHLYGQLAPMEPLAAIAAERNLLLLEDAAQCQGATQDGRTAGSWGLAGGVSFYPGKNLGAYGDAGAVLSNDDEVAARIRLIRNHGAPAKYEHTVLGFNSRLDTLQAVVLRAKLGHLAEWNRLRREAAARYDELLTGVAALRRPATLPGNEHVWHLYVVRVPGRDAVLQRLQADGIGAGIHYPIPLHLQPSLRHLGHTMGDFPVAEKAAAEILSLPIYPGITADQQEQVVAALRRAVA